VQVLQSVEVPVEAGIGGCAELLSWLSVAASYTLSAAAAVAQLHVAAEQQGSVGCVEQLQAYALRPAGA
jgi:fructose-specific phosphotransferase system component IIB